MKKYLKFERKIILQLITGLLPFAIMIGLMYFLLIRPQKKQQEKVQEMLDNLTIGDHVVTVGGMHAQINDIDDEKKIVELDVYGAYFVFERRAIARVVTEEESIMSDSEDFGLEESTTDFDHTEE